MNPMFYGTFAFLAFSSFFIVSGLWLIHGYKKDQRRRAARAAGAPESQARAAE
jgi:hypothetical protein